MGTPLQNHPPGSSRAGTLAHAGPSLFLIILRGMPCLSWPLRTGPGRRSWPPWPTRQSRRPPAQYYRGMFGWQGEVREIVAQLEQQRSRLEQVRERSRNQGGREGERLEAQATARLQEIEQRIADLRASLE